MDPGTLRHIFRVLFRQSPSLVAMFGCALTAIILLWRNPKVSARVLAGTALMILAVAGFFVMGFLILPALIGKPDINRMSSGELYEYDARMRLLSDLLVFLKYGGIAAGLWLLLTSVFMRRNASV